MPGVVDTGGNFMTDVAGTGDKNRRQLELAFPIKHLSGVQPIIIHISHPNPSNRNRKIEHQFFILYNKF